MQVYLTIQKNHCKDLPLTYVKESTNIKVFTTYNAQKNHVELPSTVIIELNFNSLRPWRIYASAT